MANAPISPQNHAAKKVDTKPGFPPFTTLFISIRLVSELQALDHSLFLKIHRETMLRSFFFVCLVLFRLAFIPFRQRQLSIASIQSSIDNAIFMK